MGGCCSVSRGSDGQRKYCSKEGIGVYVRKSHWAHALIAQNHELCEAIYKDDVRACPFAPAAAPPTRRLSPIWLLLLRLPADAGASISV